MTMTMSLLSSPSQNHLLLKPAHNPLYTASATKPLNSLTRTTTTTRALLSSTKEAVLKDFRHQRALKVHLIIVSFLHNVN